ncbi:MAG: CapA family protein [Acidobacteriota bacterium]
MVQRRRPRVLFLIPLLAGALLVCGPARARAQGHTETFRMALTGDSIITRKLSVYREPGFLRMIEILRDADVAFTNVEMLFHDYEFHPMHQSGGTYMRAEPVLARELAWAGFDLGSLANNHSGDYGPQAMLLSERYVKEAGMVAAGVGESLAEAREAKFLETGKARVALISVASTFPDHSRAGKSRDNIPARPGLNPLRHKTTYMVPREKLEELRQMLRELGREVPQEGDELSLFRRRFVAGDHFDLRTDIHQQDLEEISAVVRNASRLADYTIVTIHAHEGGKDRFVPAKFLVTFAHAMVDAGADVFVGHGPHVLRGIELYRGKPILYSLGDFIFQNETLLRLPPENYERYGLGEDSHVADFNDARYDMDRTGFPARREIWESVIATAQWTKGELTRLELHPISLGFGQPRTVRGRPMLAGSELGGKIIGDLQRLSEPFGTTIDFQDGVGLVHLPSPGTSN